MVMLRLLSTLARRFPQWDGPEAGHREVGFTNAFNYVRRNCILSATCPITMCHPLPIHPFSVCVTIQPVWRRQVHNISWGSEAGDPLGSLLFCLVLHQRSLHLRSNFKALYVLGWCPSANVPEKHSPTVCPGGQQAGATCCHVIAHYFTLCSVQRQSYTPSIPHHLNVMDEVSTFPPSVGSPIGEDECVTAALRRKVEVLLRLGDWLHAVIDSTWRSHLATPVPCTVEVNIHSPDCPMLQIIHTRNIWWLLKRDSWWSNKRPTRARQPGMDTGYSTMKLGGLGIRRAFNVAPSAYLASILFLWAG